MPLSRWSLTLVVAAGMASLLAAPQDPEMLLARTRAAMGGAVAEEAVLSLTMRGTLRRYLDGTAIDSSWEASWESPDKFVEVETQTILAGPMGTRSMTRRTGFNGDRGIQQMVSGLPLPSLAESDPDAQVPQLQHRLTRLLLPLLASSVQLSIVAPYRVVETDPRHRPSADAIVVSLEGPDQKRVRLVLDTVTHRPAMVAWRDTQITYATSTTMVQGLPMLPGMPMPTPPTTADPMVEYQMALTDYREDKGITWPRRLTVMMGGTRWEEIRVSGYTVNPRINPRTFDPVR